LQDAFRIFDHDGNGVLTCSELFSAFKWLGLQASKNGAERGEEAGSVQPAEVLGERLGWR
jgi:Ca2+-binding EF-hand superfamily protein